MEVRPLRPSDHEWVTSLVSAHFGSSRVVSRGHLHEADALPGLVAVELTTCVGLLLYELGSSELEVVVLVAERLRRGIGTALVDEAVARARRRGCSRVWSVTTNDNRPAQSFYTALGWRLAGVHHGAVIRARDLKPEIPERGLDGIPITDELEFDLVLESTPSGAPNVRLNADRPPYASCTKWPAG